MLFRRRNHTDRAALGRLTDWALGQRGAPDELERLWGREHAEELGPLGWLFRAIEANPREEPSLGRWQQFERELRQRVMLLPPRQPLLGGFLPALMLLPAVEPASLRAAVGDLAWKSAAVAAATTAISFQVISSGTLGDLQLRNRMPEIPTVSAEARPTGNVIIDRLQMNAAALDPDGSIHIR